jgi:hypothetical protein
MPAVVTEKETRCGVLPRSVCFRKLASELHEKQEFPTYMIDIDHFFHIYILFLENILKVC